VAIRVLIADDHQMMRKGLRAVLEKSPDAEVVGEAGDGRTAVQAVHDLHPDVVVLDISMPGLNGIEAARQIREESPKTKVIALSMHADHRYVTRMLQAGASGYLVKDCAVEELLGAIRSVAAGMVYLSPTVAAAVVQASTGAPTQGPAAGIQSLTGRQREVLQLLAEGLSTKQVAIQLHLSVKTVETHRQALMKRLGLTGVADLTKFALREGLVTLD
jgi:DNA-binding NarL/FixJ family response regulator